MCVQYNAGFYMETTEQDNCWCNTWQATRRLRSSETIWAFTWQERHNRGNKNGHQQVVKWLADFSGSARASLLGVLLADGDVFLHVVGGAQGHGRPLVDARGLDVQDVLVARGGHATSLLNDVSHGVALVQQPQLQGERRESVSVFNAQWRSSFLLFLEF